MKKIFTLLIGIVFSLTILNAQDAPPQAFSFKALIKDSKGLPVILRTVRLRISILEGTANGTSVYVETFRQMTNLYAQVDVEIGRGTVVSGIFATIDWAASKYYIKVDVDPKGGTNYQVMSVSQLLSVPYALYSGSAANSFSGYYSDLIGAPVLSAVALSGSYYDLLGRPPLFSGDYNELINKPSLFSGNYNDLLNKPPLFDGTWGSLSDKPVFAPIAFSGNWNDLTDSPFLILSPLANQLLMYNAVTEKWENWSPDYLTTEVDGSVTNEIQTLTINGNVLSLSDGGAVSLPAVTGQYYYADRDADSYGDHYSPVWIPSGVEPPTHFVIDNTDCNDSNPEINPGVGDVCDGKDNDCNGMIDDNCVTECVNQLSTFFACLDLHGCAYFDDECLLQTQCPPIALGACFTFGCITTLLTDPNLPFDETWESTEKAAYIISKCGTYDNDGDGITPSEGDCNDNDASVRPGAVEICGDGIDQDCNGSDPDLAYCTDNDGDGYSEQQGDCDDSDNTIYPGAAEICSDEIDQDCNGSDLVCPGDIDEDGDGYTVTEGDCNEDDPDINPGAPEICGDGIDQDCNGSDLACPDTDGDGVLDIVDNCPAVANHLQDDGDADGLGDACDNTFGVYNIVTIGNKVWMKENLRQAALYDGTPIIEKTSITDWRQFQPSPIFCTPPGLDPTRVEKYGLLYNFSTATTGKVCPVGWHVANFDDWESLKANYGGLPGQALKDNTGYWIYDTDPIYPNTNISGFSALPGGYRDGVTGDYKEFELNGYWWEVTFSSDDMVTVNVRSLESGSRALWWIPPASINSGLSIRCVKD